MTTPTTFQFNPSRVEVDVYHRCQFCGQAGAPLQRVHSGHERRQCLNSFECAARQQAEAAAMGAAS